MFQKAFSSPFKRALEDTMAVIHCPAGNVFDEQLTDRISVQLKVNVVNHFKGVYDDLEKIQKVKRRGHHDGRVYPTLFADLCMQPMSRTPFRSTLGMLSQTSLSQTSLNLHGIDYSQIQV